MPWLPMRDGHRLHVRIVGCGSPCVLLHGFGMHSRAWVPYVAPLLPWYRFIAPDLRGFGLSQDVPLNQPCVLTNYAEDLEDVLGGLDVTNVPLVGISMGASTALQSFRLFGDARFSRYLHMDQAPVIRNQAGVDYGLLGRDQGPFFEQVRSLVELAASMRPDTAFGALPAALRSGLCRVLGDVASRSFTSPMRHVIRWLSQRETMMNRVLGLEHWPTYVHILRAYLEQDYDMRRTIARIGVPITVLVGGASAVYPPDGQRTIGQLAPRAKVVELEGVGHYIPSEAPVRFLRELWRFLRMPDEAVAVA